jgi:integrase
MVPRRKRRSEWRRNKRSGWTCSLGDRGMRVRLFQNSERGIFNRAIWIPGVGEDVVSLKTADRSEAEQLGRELLANLIRGRPPQRKESVTLKALWIRYQKESQRFLDCAPSTQQDYKSRVNNFLGFFGNDCDVSTLTEHDLQMYRAKRIAGGIQTPTGRVTPSVSARSADADHVVLNTMLKWATIVRQPDGRRWLQENPLHGISRQREPNPKRPVATWERYNRTRAAMQKLAMIAKTDAERTRWVKMELALLLVEATGRRLGSVRHLRWDDFDNTRFTVRWQAEFDKKNRETVIPMPEQFIEDVKDFQRRLRALGGWIFARESDGLVPMDRHLFDKWLVAAEREAGLPKLKGGLWHPYRRKWATERKHLSIKDVAAAGGWKDHDTLLTCYQQPDEESLLAVTSEPRKLRERKTM